MPLSDTINLIKQTKQNLIGTSKGVKQAKNSYDELVEEIRLAKGRLKYKKSTKHVDTFSRKVAKAIKASKDARNILIREIDDALIRSGKEFQENSDIYKKHLYEVADDIDIYLLTVVGSGWNVAISPQIIFEHGGTLNDYARGIEEFRISINTKVGSEGTNRGFKATSWWFKNVYGTSKYARTIEQRIQFSGREAPFWSLIAHGSASMPSDRPDASYNPLPAQGVNFILNAEIAIKARFKELIGAEKLVWDSETQEFEKEIQVAEKFLDKFLNDVEGISVDYNRTQKALQDLGNDARYVSEDKLAMAAKRLRVGEEFEGQRVELTAPGFSKIHRVRPTIRQLEGLLGY